MIFWGSFITLLVGGLLGWWFGRYQMKSAANREWMTALDSAVTDNIIDDQQKRDIIRIENSTREVS
ncbi:MAG: hypothetical protein ACLFST_14295 [Spirochaetia bacterium]